MAARSIVGKWGDSPADCKSDDALKVKAMSFDNGYFICYFDSVKRRGDAVTWQGDCYVDSSRRPETGSTSVEAVVKNGKLTIEGPGFAMNSLMRCK